MTGWRAAALLMLGLLPGVGQARERAVVWTFDRLDRIGGLRPAIVGEPKVEKTPVGKVVAFDGVDDALYLNVHPLAGAKSFTIEAIFRPDGGAFAQRWLHLASDDPVDQTRMLFEIRVQDGSWYLDSFIKGKGYSQVLIDPAKRHPLGRWYHVAQSFDGVTYRAYVDGVLEAEAKVLGFVPQGAGGSSVGSRYNHVDYFKGAVRMVRFSRGVVLPADFVRIVGLCCK